MYAVKVRSKLLSGFVKHYSTKAPLQKGYKHTVLLPASDFPSHPKAIERDDFIEKNAKFSEYYNWQREHVSGNEFVLHDGPPYANGTLHMGHAINKIIKDIILRSKAIQGSKLHFVPGWDCHGLPIELIALKDVEGKLEPLEIRKRSREFALKNIKIQLETFKKWGIMGDWKNFYYTCNTDYVVKELWLFWKLYEKGFIYYGIMPVHWSPSSRTALAEAELTYNNHVSQAVTVRFETTMEFNSEPVYLLIWTTTPWTLPFNAAVCFTNALEYSLVKISGFSGYYIMASSKVKENEEKFKREIEVVRTVPLDELGSLKYKHPWRKEDVMNVFTSQEVEDVATGLLHVAPAHGRQDYLIALKYGLPVDCYVDEKGCFMDEVDGDLAGQNVFGEGATRVIEKLKNDIIFQESYTHKYPYDWRTDQPIIVRCCSQWFIDTDKLKSKSLELLENFPGSMESLKQYLRNRPYWCLSRQRVWGVPIPFFIHKPTGKTLISKELVDHLCEAVRKHGTDCWWSLDISELFPQRFCEAFGVRAEDVQRGNDIMDIWFDSGMSWYAVLDGRTADVCVEGVDQYRGWFQSLLLTSVAVYEKAPYKELLVHGMAVDEEKKKMSKSVGNVFDPNLVTDGSKALGVDTLRWWVAKHGQQPLPSVSTALMKEDHIDIERMRNTVKFLLGSLRGSTSDVIHSTKPVYQLDRYCLSASYDFYQNVVNAYNRYDLYDAVSKILFYVTNTVSTEYVSFVKDRLYCDEFLSERRRSCVYTLSGILDVLCVCIAPILPHFAEEIYFYHPHYAGRKFFYTEKMWAPPATWKDDSVGKAVGLAFEIRADVLAYSPNSKELSCSIQLEDADYQLLKGLQGGAERSFDSELTEILQVADVELKTGQRKVSLKKTENKPCPRCRRYISSNGELCARCSEVVTKQVRD